MDALKGMAEAAEQAAFEGWLASLGRDADRYVMSMWFGSSATMPTYRDRWTEGQWTGWKARAALAPKCRGVKHSGCEYLAACGSVCNKCGQVA